MGETVYVSTRSTSGLIYHTDEDCRNLGQVENVAERDLDNLPNHRECAHCAGDWQPYQDHEPGTCEYCGREFETQNGVYRHILSEHPDVVEAALGNDSTSSSGRAIADD